MRTRTIFDAYLIASYEIRTGKRGPARERQKTVFAAELLRRMDERDSLRMSARFLKTEPFEDFKPSAPISEIVPKYGPYGGAR